MTHVALNAGETLFVEASLDEQAYISNLGPGTVYYGAERVSTAAYDGTVAPGASVALTDSKWLTADDQTSLEYGSLIEAMQQANPADLFALRAWLPTHVKAYGAVGDGVTDDTAAIQACLDAVKALAYAAKCRLTVSMAGGNYRTSNTLSGDSHMVILDGGGAVVTATATDRPAIYYGATADQVEGTKTWSNNVAAIRNLTLIGPGQDQTASSGLSLQVPTSTSTTLGPARMNVENVAIFKFGVGIGYKDNTYGIVHRNIGVYQCDTAIYEPFNVTNGGERMTYFGGFIGDCRLGVNNSNGGCNMEFHAFSFDYPSWPASMNSAGVAGTTNPQTLLLYASKGQIECHGCHFESNVNLDYWFRAGDSSSRIALFGGRIVFGGSKNTYPPFYVGQDGTFAGSVEHNGVILDGVHFHQSASYTYDLGRLVDGGGRVQARNLTWERNITNWMAPLAHFLDSIDGTFEQTGALTDWTLTSSTAGSEPTIDATTAYAGSNSLRFKTVVAGNNSKAFVNIPVRPGQLLLMSFRNQITGATAGSVNLKVTFKQFRASNTQYGSSATYGNSTGADFWQDTSGWVLRKIAPQIAGPGVTYIQVLVEANGWPTTATAWVDDLVVNVI